MQIIRATESIVVEHPVTLIFGQPGIGKSTLGYSAHAPLLLDVDQGAHRAANRGDTLKVTTWAEIAELAEQRAALAPYHTVVVDTVGRLLDLLAADIIEANPKYARDGALTLQGFGVLKTRFRLWLTQLRTWGTDVVLLAHHREEKDGDLTVMRPDIIGASYGEVMKSADFVGYYAMVGKQRILDFSPTDRWVGKNPAQWKPVVVPALDKATTVLAGLLDQGRAALGQISQASVKQAEAVEAWRRAIAGYTTAEDFTRGRTELEAAPEIVKAQLRTGFKAAADKLGLTFDKVAKQYVAPVPKVNAAPAPVTAEEIVW